MHVVSPITVGEQIKRGGKSYPLNTVQYFTLFQAPNGLPPPRNCDHAINLLLGSKPVNQQPYRYSYEQKNIIEMMVRKILEEQASSSPFASLVISVKKKDFSWRFCVDYRKLNELTLKNKYPIPAVEDLLDELQGAKLFSKLNLRLGCHQIRMRRGDEYKTAFKTHHGLWEFRIIPFGLTNALATFQALMHEIFGPYLRKFVLVFFDDILVNSANLEDHIRHLRRVFELFQQNRLFAK
uniref:RNA-directed DNA polymerase homolog n=1 Tax=Nicotiana tabacum TaxID=4097 RepID=A0A1S4C026_TOBAC|nr:PREDICTED: RNA-directed DNA polymerase homolog [Nicotiana tabacum]